MNMNIDTGIVVLDFYSDSCMPCRLQVPKFEQAAAKLENQAAFHQVNIATQPELAVRFGVMSIPTIVVLNNGQEQWRSVGLTEADEIISAVTPLI